MEHTTTLHSLQETSERRLLAFEEALQERLARSEKAVVGVTLTGSRHC